MENEMKKIVFLILFIFFIKSEIISQPYTYYSIAYNSNVTASTSDMKWDIYQHDFKNHQSKLVLDSVNVGDYIWDNTGNWFILKYNRDYAWISNFNENINYKVTDDILQFGALLYSKLQNKLYIFSSYRSVDTCMLSSFSLSDQKFEELQLITPNSLIDNFNNREAFLSADEKTIYFAYDDDKYADFTPQRYYLKYYSTQSKSIYRIRPLSDFGYPGSKAFTLQHGRQGVSIIESNYQNPNGNWEDYFRIYNFDNDSGYAFIKALAWSKPYFTNNGKYLILSHIYGDKTKQTDLNNGILDIYSSMTGQLIKTVNYTPKGFVFSYDDYPNQLFYFLQDSTKQTKSYTIDVDSIVNSLKVSPYLNVKLVNSTGSTIPGGSLQYYDGSWKDAINNNNGTFSIDTKLKTVSLKITYAYGTQTLSNVTVGKDTLKFQTVNSQVKLQNSTGNPIDQGTIQYYSGTWRDFGSTTGGTVSKELLPGSYSFRMTYAYASNDKAQDIGINPIVVFQTKNAQVQLKNSSGNPIDQGTVQYYAGQWRDFGTTINGVASAELLPNNYSFRMTYAYASNDKQQDIGANSTVMFQTTNAQVQFKNSLGNLIDQGTVQYYSGAWRSLGTTTNGIASIELLPNNYSFRITYAFASNDKQQDINLNPIVVFQTKNALVQLKNSSGNPIDQGTVQYYSGAWRTFGTTTNGVASVELLPNNYSFRMTYAYASNDKQQDIGANSTVVFQTINAQVQLKNSLGNLIDQGTVQYYSGAWRSLGTTTNGIASMELLPNNYSFRMTYAYASNDKQQDIGANSTVVFQTTNAQVQLKNSLGNLIDQGTVQYYSGAWRSLGTTTNGITALELLPNTYSFRMTYGFISKDISQNIALNNIVTYSTVLCTVKVNNSQNQPVNNADIKYYSGAWREIGMTTNGVITKELLPASLSFRVNYNSTQKDMTQDISINNIVVFGL
jgi:hypothetical protein